MMVVVVATINLHKLLDYKGHIAPIRSLRRMSMQGIHIFKFKHKHTHTCTYKCAHAKEIV